MVGKRIFEDKTLKSSKLKCKEKRKKQQKKQTHRNRDQRDGWLPEESGCKDG